MTSILDHLRRRTPRFDRPVWVFVLYGGIAVVPMLIRYLGITIGEAELYFDAGERWLPIARQLSEGHVLYRTTLFDNKTPLFHALNYAVYVTGNYVLA